MSQAVQTYDAHPAELSETTAPDEIGQTREGLQDSSAAKRSNERQSDDFVDRRRGRDADAPSRDRRQFANSHQELSPEASRLAAAIDEYKLRHRRRFITYEEMLGVIKELGYKLS